jgi:hypothetical protein
MKRAIGAALALCLISGAAFAQLSGLPCAINARFGLTAPCPIATLGCSLGLRFNQKCNSQYLGSVLR